MRGCRDHQKIYLFWKKNDDLTYTELLSIQRCTKIIRQLNDSKYIHNTMITDYIGGLLRTCYGIGLRNGLQGKRYLSPLTAQPSLILDLRSPINLHLILNYPKRTFLISYFNKCDQELKIPFYFPSLC